MKPLEMADPGAQYRRLKVDVDAAVARVMASGRYILGPECETFETEMADYVGVGHALGCASGTDALQLALLAAGIGPGDEVITTPFTFGATAEAIRHCGGVPVFVDIDERTFNLDPERVEAAIGERTRAIVAVHLFGQPADMPALAGMAEKHGIDLIEDCAQSLGAEIGGRRTGAMGRAGCFSFFPSKNLGACGDGGLIVTGEERLAETVRMLRNHGQRPGDKVHEVVGYNSRLDELQAAILRVKLRHIEQFNGERRRAADCYRRRLRNSPLVLPFEDERGRHVYHQFTVLVPEGRREPIIQALHRRAIASAVYYPVPLHRQPAFQQHSPAEPLTVSERVARRCLSLPIFPGMTGEQIERVANCLLENV